MSVICVLFRLSLSAMIALLTYQYLPITINLRLWYGRASQSNELDLSESCCPSVCLQTQDDMNTVVGFV